MRQDELGLHVLQAMAYKNHNRMMVGAVDPYLTALGGPLGYLISRTVTGAKGVLDATTLAIALVVYSSVGVLGGVIGYMIFHTVTGAILGAIALPAALAAALIVTRKF